MLLLSYKCIWLEFDQLPFGESCKTFGCGRVKQDFYFRYFFFFYFMSLHFAAATTTATMLMEIKSN